MRFALAISSSSGVLGVGALVGLAVALTSGVCTAEEAAASDESSATTRPAPVALDALFRLPSDAGAPSAGDVESADRRRWEERFAAVRGDLEQAREQLATAQAELEQLARSSENWQMAAPGAQHNPETSPISFKLRADIRRHREDITLAEKRLRELEVEASLAGVPVEWRRPTHEDAAPGS